MTHHIRIVEFGPDVDLSRAVWRIVYDLGVAALRPSRPPALIALYDGVAAGLRPKPASGPPRS